MAEFQIKKKGNLTLGMLLWLKQVWYYEQISVDDEPGLRDTSADLVALGTGVWQIGKGISQAILKSGAKSATKGVIAEITPAEVVKKELEGAGKSAAQKLVNLAGKTRQTARDILRGEGFVDKGTTAGGYEKWYHPDGSRVQIRPNGEVVRTAPKTEGYRPRIGPDGNRTSTHNNGERVN